MFKRIISCLCIFIFFSSCANPAQEFSVSNLKKAVATSPDYNQKDDFYYPILKNGGAFLNLTQAVLFEDDTDILSLAYACAQDSTLFCDQELKKRAIEDKKEVLISAQSFADEFHTYTKQDLEECLFQMQKMPYPNKLQQEEEKIKQTVIEYIQAKYSQNKKYNTQSKTLKKAIRHFISLKADSLWVSGLRLEVCSYSTIPYVKAHYILNTKKDGLVASTAIEENFLVEPIKQNNKFIYQIGYVFTFNQSFDKTQFLQSMAVNFNQTPSNTKLQYALAQSEIQPLKITALEWMQTSCVAKNIQENFAYLVNQSWDLTSQFCTQNPDYLDEVVFIGDSIFSGFAAYGLPYGRQLLTKVGVGSRNIFELELQSKGIVYTLEEFIKSRDPKYAYIMLGLNDINMIDTKAYEENFKTIISTIQHAKPDIQIVLVSMTPIKRLNYSTPQWISQYNQVLQQLAKDLSEVYYLDMFDFLSVDGILANKYSAADGIHFTGPTYEMMIDYIYVHQIKPYPQGTDLSQIAQSLPQEVFVDEQKIQAIIASQQEKGPATPFSKPRTRKALI